MLSGANAQVVPNNLLWEHTELTGGHLGVGLGLSLLHHQPGILGRALGIEFQEDGTHELSLALPVLVLLGLDLGNELSQVLASVCDGVDLLANEKLEAVGGAVLWVAKLVNAFSGLVRLLSLARLHAVQVGIAGKLNLAIFKLQCGSVAVLDQLLQLLAVGGNPCVLHAGEHLEEGGLGEVLGDVGEEDGLGGQAAGAKGRSSVCLAQVDGVEALAGNDDHDQQQEDKRDQGVGIVAVHIGDVAHGEQVKLLLASTTGGIDGEQDGPCDDAAKEADDNEQLEEAHEEVAVDGLVVEDVLVLDAAEVLDPAEEAIAGRGGLAVVAQAVDVGSGRIQAAEGATEDQEEGHEDHGRDGGGDEGRHEARQRAVFGLVAVGPCHSVVLVDYGQRPSSLHDRLFTRQAGRQAGTHSRKEVHRRHDGLAPTEGSTGRRDGKEKK